MHLDAAGITDPGRIRPANEDALLCEPERGLFAVADGMGGHAAGEVASAMALEELARESRTLPDDPDVESAAAAVDRAVRSANERIRARAAAEPDKAGMGTTLTALITVPSASAAVVGHVGDSRAYRLRDGRLERLTTDHTWVEEQVVRGRLSRDAARQHPYANILTRAVGVEDALEVEILRLDLLDGDLFLLCSDGLTGPVSEAQMEEILRLDVPLRERAAALVEAANRQGGPDNITVVLTRAGGSPTREAPPPPRPAA